MRYLIDTNIFIRMANDSGFLSADVRTVIEDYENIIFVSSESIKEYIHLVQSGKVEPQKTIISTDIISFIEDTLGFNVKYAAKEHLLTFAKLPTIEGHNDPSDRLIIAQAITEKIPLISSDKQFPKYRRYGLNFIPNY